MSEGAMIGLIVGAVVLLASFLGVFITPIVKLNTTITKLNDKLENMSENDKKRDKRLDEHSKKIDANHEEIIRHDEILIRHDARLNKLENKKILPKYSKFNLADFLGQTLLTFEQIWEEKNILLDVNLDENIFINTDKTLLEIVCNNIISNALKFTEPNGKVFISCYKDESYASIYIQDTGCGISNETGKHIFEKFYQGDTSHKEQGNGLGLALVKRIIDVLGAEIAIKSEVGVGSTFIIKINTK